MSPFVLSCVLLLLAVADVASAQSLGDAAAQAKEKRNRRPPVAVKSYTDADLAPVDENEKKKKKDGAGGRQTSTEEPAREPGPDEGAWRARGAAARQAIRDLEAKARQVQETLNGLMLDRNPSGLFDPNRLQTIENEKAKAREELEATRTALAAAQKALDDLEDEARRQRIPPGWVREP